MMRSKSFEMQEMRDRPEGSRRVKGLYHLTDGNIRCLPGGRKGMQSQGKIENV